jgi:glycosyltransferase involved in cell wall biosynthesis
MKNKTVTIVFSYYNRKKQFLFTMKTLAKTKYNKALIDIVVVDDGSDDEHLLDEGFLYKHFKIPIKVIRIEKTTKTWLNPCVAYNIGFKYAKGDIIIYQNPECCHVNDIISYTVENLEIEEYFSFACVAILQPYGDNATLYCYDNFYKIYCNCKKYVLRINKLGIRINENITYCLKFYNHQWIKPKHYHFCAAIHKSQMMKLNGFNEHMKDKYCYDDDEILLRISLLCKKIIVPMENGFVIHQYHESSIPPNTDMTDVSNQYLYEKYEKLFNAGKLDPDWREN